jgi:hypothetical protein
LDFAKFLNPIVETKEIDKKDIKERATFCKVFQEYLNSFASGSLISL